MLRTTLFFVGWSLLAGCGGMLRSESGRPTPPTVDATPDASAAGEVSRDTADTGRARYPSGG